MKLLRAITISLIVFSFLHTKADSPITSTPFSKAYKSKKIVKKAKEANGVINVELMEYLSGKNPIDLKMAVINELSWDINGKNNAGVFYDFLIETKYKKEKKLLKKASADEWLCLAYLSAMDDYFNVVPASIYAEKALKKNPESYTFQIITALIKAQYEFDYDWCNVYKATDEVRTNKSLKMDMKPKAISIIFEYMDLYKSSCNN